MTSGRRPEVSVIVPVRNGERWLAALIESIRANSYPDALVEVLIADHASSDRSVEVAAAAGATVFPAGDGPVARIRNEAVRRARGEVLAFIDADHAIDRHWIESAIETLSLPGVGAVGALCHAPSNGSWVQRIYDGLRGRHDGTTDVEWLGSGNLAMWRAVFDEVGGFDPTLETCEDVDLCRRIRARRHRLVSDSRLRNVHYGDPATLSAVVRGELWRGRDNLRVSLRGGRSWRTLPGLLMPVAGLVALACMLLSPALAWQGHTRLALAPFALLLALWGIRAAVMIRRRKWRSPIDWIRAGAVAAAYETGRSLALVAGSGHGMRHRDAS